MADGDGPSATVEKIMSITRAEFEAGLRRLTGTPPHSNDRGDYVVAGVGAERQTVCCSFEPLPDAVLGGLVKLPRVRVKLQLAALSSEARAAFVALFERTFQRGGG